MPDDGHLHYLRAMPAKRKKALPAVKPVARRVRVSKSTRAAKPTGPTKVVKVSPAKSVRKIFGDRSLFGALPGMSEWALPLLKELRDE